MPNHVNESAKIQQRVLTVVALHRHFDPRFLWVNDTAVDIGVGDVRRVEKAPYVHTVD